MQKIVININSSIRDHIMFFLQNLPKNLVDIQEFSYTPNNKKSNQKAFGILKGKIKDPVKWQEDIREENDRDIYKSFNL